MCRNLSAGPFTDFDFRHELLALSIYRFVIDSLSVDRRSLSDTRSRSLASQTSRFFRVVTALGRWGTSTRVRVGQQLGEGGCRPNRISSFPVTFFVAPKWGSRPPGPA